MIRRLDQNSQSLSLEDGHRLMYLSEDGAPCLQRNIRSAKTGHGFGLTPVLWLWSRHSWPFLKSCTEPARLSCVHPLHIRGTLLSGDYKALHKFKYLLCRGSPQIVSDS